MLSDKDSQGEMPSRHPINEWETQVHKIFRAAVICSQDAILSTGPLGRYEAINLCEEFVSSTRKLGVGLG